MQSEIVHPIIQPDCLEVNQYQYQFSISLKYEIIKNHYQLDLNVIKIIHQQIIDMFQNSNWIKQQNEDDIKGLIILYSTIFKYFYQDFSNQFVDTVLSMVQQNEDSAKISFRLIHNIILEMSYKESKDLYKSIDNFQNILIFQISDISFCYIKGKGNQLFLNPELCQLCLQTICDVLEFNFLGVEEQEEPLKNTIVIPIKIDKRSPIQFFQFLRDTNFLSIFFEIPKLFLNQSENQILNNRIIQINFRLIGNFCRISLQFFQNQNIYIDIMKYIYLELIYLIKNFTQEISQDQYLVLEFTSTIAKSLGLVKFDYFISEIEMIQYIETVQEFTIQILGMVNIPQIAINNIFHFWEFFNYFIYKQYQGTQQIQLYFQFIGEGYLKYLFQNLDYQDTMIQNLSDFQFISMFFSINKEQNLSQQVENLQQILQDNQKNNHQIVLQSHIVLQEVMDFVRSSINRDEIMKMKYIYGKSISVLLDIANQIDQKSYQSRNTIDFIILEKLSLKIYKNILELLIIDNKFELNKLTKEIQLFQSQTTIDPIQKLINNSCDKIIQILNYQNNDLYSEMLDLFKILAQNLTYQFDYNLAFGYYKLICSYNCAIDETYLYKIYEYHKHGNFDMMQNFPQKRRQIYQFLFQFISRKQEKVNDKYMLHHFMTGFVKKINNLTNFCQSYQLIEDNQNIVQDYACILNDLIGITESLHNTKQLEILIGHYFIYTLQNILIPTFDKNEQLGGHLIDIKNYSLKWIITIFDFQNLEKQQYFLKINYQDLIESHNPSLLVSLAYKICNKIIDGILGTETNKQTLYQAQIKPIVKIFQFSSQILSLKKLNKTFRLDFMQNKIQYKEQNIDFWNNYFTLIEQFSKGEHVSYIKLVQSFCASLSNLLATDFDFFPIKITLLNIANIVNLLFCFFDQYCLEYEIIIKYLTDIYKLLNEKKNNSSFISDYSNINIATLNEKCLKFLIQIINQRKNYSIQLLYSILKFSDEEEQKFQFILDSQITLNSDQKQSLLEEFQQYRALQVHNQDKNAFQIDNNQFQELLIH